MGLVRLRQANTASDRQQELFIGEELALGIQDLLASSV